jgi:hypothetical protein
MAARVFKASVTLLTFEQEAVATSCLPLSPSPTRFLSQKLRNRLARAADGRPSKIDSD